MREDAASTSGESSEGGGSDGEDGEEGAQGTPLPPPRPRDDPARRAGGWAWMPAPQQSGGAALTTFEARWPPEIVEALRTEVSTMSMPAGEMFGVLLAVAMARDAGARAIIVVTDCAPVAGAVNASGSPSPQLHHLVRGVQRVANGAQVLAVHVKREHNQVADDLSKGLGPKVRAAAKAEGFGTAEWHVPEHCWRWLREAAGMPLSA